MSDEICLNLNVSLRSLTQAAIVLVFMFQASWRLTIVTFIMVPAIITMTKVYGDYYTCASCIRQVFILRVVGCTHTLRIENQRSSWRAPMSYMPSIDTQACKLC